MLGHIGDGNFHETILFDSTKPGETEKVQKCVGDMVNLALEMEGTCTVRIPASLQIPRLGGIVPQANVFSQY